jgi:hypothetical protein
MSPETKRGSGAAPDAAPGWFTRLWRHHRDRSPLYNLTRRARHQPTTWDRVIADADLPAVIEGAISRILRRVRVLPFEKSAFAAELVAHCRDGLDAGTSPEDLARGLGSPRRVGPLVTRAIRRKRPRFVRTFFGSLLVLRRTVVTLVVGYAVLSVWFFSRRPEITVDHFAELRAPSESLAISERAAPVIVEQMAALRAMQDERAEAMGVEPNEQNGERYVQLPPNWLGWFPSIHDEDPQADEVLDLLLRAEPIVRELWAVTDRAALGPEYKMEAEKGDLLGEALIGVLLPHLSATRNAGRLLALDAAASAARGDAERTCRDLESIAHLARLTQASDSIIITRLVGYALLAFAAESTGAILRDYPELLDADQLARLQHALDQPVNVSIDDERRMHADIVQRSYAPGPNGRLTVEGVRVLRLVSSLAAEPGWFDPTAVLSLATGPITSLWIVDRETSVRNYRAITAAYEELVSHEVPQNASWTRLLEFDERPNLAQLRDPVTDTLRAAYNRVASSVLGTRTRRDAIVVTLAAHRYRLDHGVFPGDTCGLVPSYLDRVPPDRYDGQPMRLIGGDALTVYTLGVDRDDDNARRPIDGEQRGKRPVWEFTPSSPGRASDADWVLFPPDSDPFAPIREALRN